MFLVSFYYFATIFLVWSFQEIACDDLKTCSNHITHTIQYDYYKFSNHHRQSLEIATHDKKKRKGPAQVTRRRNSSPFRWGSIKGNVVDGCTRICICGHGAAEIETHTRKGAFSFFLQSINLGCRKSIFELWPPQSLLLLLL